MTRVPGRVGSGSQEHTFYQRVYDLVRRIPPGRVMTYGQVARAVGKPRGARMVGWAMRACPEDVPWQRVVNSRGGLSTQSLHAGFNLQHALLEDEGIEFDSAGRIDLSQFGWQDDTWR
jgi:methylated-DNA-protein-cysteine methyltransferase-like protein